MTKQKSTKRALLASGLALFMCISMFVGSTFAWFTDSVKTGVNTIQSGTLDVDLVDANDKSMAGEVVEFVTADGRAQSEILWEPGCTYKTEPVFVVNKGNLDLKYRITITGITGDAKLLEAIDWKITVGTEEANLDDLIGGLLAGKKTEALVIEGHMREDAGNEYMGLKAENIAITVFATQLASEFDSYDNQYDKAAPWTGGIAQPEQKDGVWQIGSGEELAWFAKYVNGEAPITFNRGIVATHNAVLTSDINLSDISWTPIGRTLTDEEKAAGNHAFDFQFRGTSNVHAVFDGQGHTIYNLNVSGAQNSGLFGAAVYATIKNVNVTGAKIVSNHFAGTVLAQGYARVENCNVKDSTVICTPELVKGSWDNGDKAGGVVGKISEGGANSSYGAVNCSAENVSVTAYRDAGGILGYAGNYAKVTGNKVTNITMKQDATHDYKAYDSIAKYNINAVVGDSTRAPGVVVDGNTESNVTIVPMATAKTVSENIKNAGEGDVVFLAANTEYALPTLADKTGITIEGAADGSTVIGGDSVSTGFGGNFGKDTTVKNLTFAGKSNGVRYSYAKGGTTTFDNCTFAGDSTYGFHMDQSNGATLIFNNCTFVGFNAFASDLKEIEFNNCTFLSNGNYGHSNVWTLANFNNCTWGDKTSVSQGYSSKEKKYYGTLIFNGVEESYHHEFIGSAESLFDFAKSVNEGGDSWKNQKVALVADIDLGNKAWTPIGQTGATEFKGIFDGQGYTIKNLNVDNSAATDEHTSSGLFGWAESNVTIKNVNIDGATIKGNHNVAAIVGYTYSGKISNCHVSNATLVCTHANGEACGDKAGTIAGYAGDESRFSDCSASNSTVKGGRDAGQLIGAGYNVSISNCKATNVAVSATGDCNREGNINNAIIGRIL